MRSVCFGGGREDCVLKDGVGRGGVFLLAWTGLDRRVTLGRRRAAATFVSKEKLERDKTLLVASSISASLSRK